MIWWTNLLSIPSLKICSAMILLTKFFPDPVQPLKESAKALFGDLLFRCPTIALSTVSVTKCCPNTRRRRADCRPVMFAEIHLSVQHSLNRHQTFAHKLKIQTQQSQRNFPSFDDECLSNWSKTQQDKQQNYSNVRHGWRCGSSRGKFLLALYYSFFYWLL